MGEAPIHAVQAAQQRGPTRGTAESGEATRTTAPPAGCTIYQLWSIHPSPPLATGWAAGASTSGTGWRTSLRRRHPPVEGRAPLTWTPRDGACLGRPPSTLSGAHAAAVSWWGVYVLYPNRPPGGAWYGCPRPTAGTAAPSDQTRARGGIVVRLGRAAAGSAARGMTGQAVGKCVAGSRRWASRTAGGGAR